MITHCLAPPFSFMGRAPPPLYDPGLRRYIESKPEILAQVARMKNEFHGGN